MRRLFFNLFTKRKLASQLVELRLQQNELQDEIKKARKSRRKSSHLAKKAGFVASEILEIERRFR